MTNRDGFAGTYYLLLNKLRFLQPVLPCTADIVLEKVRRSSGVRTSST
jgi:hypothetical protein